MNDVNKKDFLLGSAAAMLGLISVHLSSAALAQQAKALASQIKKELGME